MKLVCVCVRARELKIGHKMQRDEGKLDPRREREREGGREREREKESSIPPFTHHPQIVLLEMQNAAGVPHTQS